MIILRCHNNNVNDFKVSFEYLPNMLVCLVCAKTYGKAYGKGYYCNIKGSRYKISDGQIPIFFKNLTRDSRDRVESLDFSRLINIYTYICVYMITRNVISR